MAHRNPTPASAALIVAAPQRHAPAPRVRRRPTPTLRRALLLSLTLASIAITTLAQALLSPLAQTNAGAANVNAPPLLVALLLFGSLAAAIALRVSAPPRIPTAPRQPTITQSAHHPLLAPARLIARINPTRWSTRLTHSLRRASAALTLPRSPRAWASLAALSVALITSLIADAAATQFSARPFAQWCWLASAAMLIAAATLAPAHPLPTSARLGWRLPSAPPPPLAATPARFWRRWRRWSDLLLLALLLAIALLLRLPNLATTPYIVHGDEAACGLEALRWLHGDIPSLLSTGWYGLPVAGYGIPALVMRVVGANLIGLRLSSVLIGALSIAFCYALARECAGRRLAFLATAFLTVAHLHIQFSRMGIHYIYAPCVIALTLWLFVRGLRLASPPAASLAGLSMSLALQVYFSARILFVIIPLLLLGLLLLNRHLLAGRWRALLWFTLSACVAIGPLAIYFLSDLASLTGRAQEVLILNTTPTLRAHLISQFGAADLPTVLLRQLAAVPLIPGALADQSLQYGPPFPMFGPLAAALVLVGLWYALLTPRRPLSLILLTWTLPTVLFGGVLTIDLPWWPRLLALLPALCLLAALALHTLLTQLEHALTPAITAALEAPPHSPARQPAPSASPIAWRALACSTLLAASVLIASAYWNINNYTTTYPRAANADPYRTRYTDLGHALARLPADTPVILFSANDLIWDYPTLHLLAPTVTGQLVTTPAALAYAVTRACQYAPTVTIIVTPTDLQDARHTLTPAAAAALLPHRNPGGAITFFLATVPCSPAP